MTRAFSNNRGAEPTNGRSLREGGTPLDFDLSLCVSEEFDGGTGLCLAVSPVPGDLNGDGCVDLSDLAVLLGDFGCTAGGCAADIDGDGDGDTDLADLATQLSNFGQCRP